MMRQTKAVLAAGAMAAILAISLGIFGCARSDTDQEHMNDEHMNGEQMHDNADAHHSAQSMVSDSEMPAESAAENSNGNMSNNSEQMEASGTISNGVRIVEVRARQFEFDPDTIVVNQGENVRLRITSEDVTHGFGLEEFDIDRTLPPNETQIIEFTADQQGRHHFHCTHYCGEGHDEMHGELMVKAN